MGLIKSMADEMIREIGNKSREFYEFILPPVDMHVRDGRELVVTIDLPGFDKKDIKLHLDANILSIKAEKPKGDQGGEGSVVCSQRPSVIEKKVRLPVRIREGEEAIESTRFADGVLTLVIPFTGSGKDITIE